MHREIVNVINAIGTLLYLTIDHPSITFLSKQFNWYGDDLETEIMNSLIL